MSGYYRNNEGYSDPTAGAALSKIVGEEKRKARAERRKEQRKRNKKPDAPTPVSNLQVSTNIDKTKSEEVQT